MGVNTFAKPKIHPLQVGWAAGELESDKAKTTDALQEFRYAVNAEYMGGFDGLHFLRNIHDDDVLQSLHLQFTTPLKPIAQPARERVPLASLFELDVEQEQSPEATEPEQPSPPALAKEIRAPVLEEEEDEEPRFVAAQAEQLAPTAEPAETHNVEDDVQSVASSPSSNSSRSSVSIPGPMRKSSLNLASLPPREPVRRPSGRQSPLKHAKNKLSAILKNGRDLIAASAATSADAKASVLDLESGRESPTRQLTTVMSHSSVKDRDARSASDKRLEEARAAQERLAHQRAVERREAQQVQAKTPAQRQRERAERAKVSQEEQAREEAKKSEEIRRKQEEDAKNAGERKRAALEQKKQRVGQGQAYTPTIGRPNSKELLAQKTRQARLEAQRAAQQEQERLQAEKREAELEAQRREAAIERERLEAERREAEQEAQRRREADEEERRRAELEAQSRQAALEEKRRQAELEEQRRQAELEEQRRQAALEEERRQAELEARRRQAALEAEQRAKQEAEELEAARRKAAIEEELRKEREAERRRQAMEEEIRARQERQQRLEAQQRLQEQRRLEAEKREAAAAAAAHHKAVPASGSRMIPWQEQQKREAERQLNQQTKNAKAQDETQYRANPSGAKGQQRIMLPMQEQRRIEAERREAAKREAQAAAGQRALEDQQRPAPPSTQKGVRTVLKKPSLKHQASQEQIGSDSKRLRMSKDLESDQGKSLSGPPIRPSGGFKKSSLAQGPSGSSMVPAPATLNKTKIGRPLDMAKVSKAPIPFAPNPNPAGPATFKTPARPPNPTTTALKSAQPHRPSPIQNGDAIELPEIYTDDEDEDYDAELIPSWANTPNITEQLIRQETINPTGIFGPPQPLDMEAVFDRSKERFSSFRKRTSSANWDSGDRLTVEEIRKDMAARKRLRKEGAWTMDLARDML